MKVAVIGAGVAGLLAARELQREGHRVVVYEKADRLGGTWVYDSRIESDPLGLDPNREIVHGSLYRSLRTNLPRPLMGFSDYPFTAKKYGDPRDFPGHEEVLKFLENFAEDFGLTELIRFNEEVVRVERVEVKSSDEWIVESRTSGTGSESEEVFEAVVVCSGHFVEPRLAKLPGISKWPRKQIHSHSYRDPEPFRGEVVVIIGSAASAYDISREIASVAKEVHLSSRSSDVEMSKFKNYENIWLHPKIERVCGDGTITFHDGLSVQADTILHCSGYNYYFPFLKTNEIINVDDNRVGPLYKHVFPPQLAPRLAFIGIPQRTIIFTVMELQSKWIAQVLSGKVLLPSEEEMLADVEEYYKHMEKCGTPKHQTHCLTILANYLQRIEFEYLDWLAYQVGLPALEERIKAIYRNVITCAILQKDGFRDDWDANNLNEHEN